MNKLWLVIFLLIFPTISVASSAITEPATTSIPVRSWCGFQGRAVECQMGTDGIYRPTTVQYLLHQFFGEVEEEARKIARCESNFNNSAIGKAGEIGVFQIHPVHFKEVESLKLDLHTLEGNFAYSRILYSRESWQPWSCARLTGVIK